MGITISVGLQKGGVAKTTTTAILSYLLSQEAKVLAVDFDSQGNLSEFLSRKDISEFEGKTIFEACEAIDPTPYIYRISDTLDLLPADNMLGMWNRLVERSDVGILFDTLDKISRNYDYIIIDMAPQLGEATASALYASDFTFSTVSTDPLSWKAINRYINFVRAMQTKKPSLVYAGILQTMYDPRLTIEQAAYERVRMSYPELVFETFIPKRTRLKEYSLTGIEDKTVADRAALAPYKAFLGEMRAIVHKKA
jgi:chromosome partitioning protein